MVLNVKIIFFVAMIYFTIGLILGLTKRYTLGFKGLGFIVHKDKEPTLFKFSMGIHFALLIISLLLYYLFFIYIE